MLGGCITGKKQNVDNSVKLVLYDAKNLRIYYCKMTIKIRKLKFKLPS